MKILTHNPFRSTYSLALLLFLLPFCSSGQVCTGTLGDPVVKLDFGSGAPQYGAPLASAVTNYTYVAATPNDGEYTIAKNTYGMHADTKGWYQVANHTPSDPNGYMMVVNANNNPGLFYQNVVTGLCPNTTYEFAAWIINILNYSGNKPNITFAIYDTSNNLLANYTTGNIPEHGGWKQYALTFRTPSGISDIILKMINNGPGGDGNDIALDDITFRPCGPSIVPSIDAVIGQSASICEGQSRNYTLKAEIQTGYSNPEFQWQRYNGTTWVDELGKTTQEITIGLVNATPGTVQMRMLAAEAGSINSPNCRTVSPVFTITVSPLTAVTPTSNSPVCAGNEIQLSSNEGTAYLWTGPNGFTSTARSPVIPNATAAMAGDYFLTLTNSNGCEMNAKTSVIIDQPPVASVTFHETTICETASVTLQASGGTTYTWSPATGLSDANIADPIATPLVTTTYTVTVSNGACTSTETVTVNVNKAAKAIAGPDRTIVEGQSIVLDGKVEGDNVTYLWTPSDYLDDPSKANPVASPTGDIAYKLTVTSTSGCTGSEDEVFIRVYKKVIVQNTFSPNGDGVNDTWNIIALDAYPKNNVQVFSRNGNVVFSRNDYKNDWDGKYKGKPLPVGVYYYKIYLDEVNKQLSGWVTIIK